MLYEIQYTYLVNEKKSLLHVFVLNADQMKTVHIKEKETTFIRKILLSH